MIRERRKIWLFITLLAVCGTTSFASCSLNKDNASEQSNITVIANNVWAFSQTHTNGFTIDIRTMTEPTEGIAVSYAATQNSHSRDQLDKVVKHALQHEGYVSNYSDIPLDGKVAEILERDTIFYGTTGDYRPLSFCEPDGTYWGFGIEVANEIAKRLITITDARRETMLMSEGYLANGKTILCRATEADRYKSLEDIDKPEVTVMVNPGGLNEKFANENLTHAKIVVHQKNEEIPALVAEGVADVMITEITEAPYYVQTDTRLAAPLLNAPFNHGEIGVLMQKGQDDLLQMVNNVIRQMKSDGSLRKLHEKYGLVYAYNP